VVTLRTRTGYARGCGLRAGLRYHATGWIIHSGSDTPYYKLGSRFTTLVHRLLCSSRFGLHTLYVCRAVSLVAVVCPVYGSLRLPDTLHGCTTVWLRMHYRTFRFTRTTLVTAGYPALRTQRYRITTVYTRTWLPRLVTFYGCCRSHVLTYLHPSTVYLLVPHGYATHTLPVTTRSSVHTYTARLRSSTVQRLRLHYVTRFVGQRHNTHWFWLVLGSRFTRLFARPSRYCSPSPPTFPTYGCILATYTAPPALPTTRFAATFYSVTPRHCQPAAACGLFRLTAWQNAAACLLPR